MRVFVTGATGNIGRSMVKTLVARGHAVHGLTTRAERASMVSELGGTPVIGDMTNLEPLASVVGEAEAIIHAGQTSLAGRVSGAAVERHARANAAALDQMRTLAKKCRAFVFTSGCWVYAPSETPLVESDAVAPPEPALDKLASETKLLAWAKDGSLPAIITRPGAVISPSGVWKEFVLDPMKKKKKARVLGNGRNLFSYVHAVDCAVMHALLIEEPQVGQIFNIGGGEPATATLAFAQHLATRLGAPAPGTLPSFVVKLATGKVSVPLLQSRPLSSDKFRKAYPGFAYQYPTAAAVADGLASEVI